MVIKELKNELLIHQYAYYIACDPLINDYAYDILESQYTKKTGKDMIIGSDHEPSYPSWVKNEYLKRKGR